MKVEFLSAVLLASTNHDRLAAFYRDVIGVPLEEEEHGPLLKHYGCELGDLHFAIHPAENFAGEGCGVGSVRLAFEVFDMEVHVKRLAAHGVQLLYPPWKMGPMTITAIRDPDGNVVEFTQLDEQWYDHLEKRRAEGHDMVRRWKATGSRRALASG